MQDTLLVSQATTQHHWTLHTPWAAKWLPSGSPPPPPTQYTHKLAPKEVRELNTSLWDAAVGSGGLWRLSSSGDS